MSVSEKFEINKFYSLHCFMCQKRVAYLSTENGLPVCNSPLCLKRQVRWPIEDDIIVQRDAFSPLQFFKVIHKTTYNGTKVLKLTDEDTLPKNEETFVHTFGFFKPEVAGGDLQIAVPFPIEVNANLEAERTGDFPDWALNLGYSLLLGFDSDERMAVIQETLRELNDATE